jgi:hypothetical protein
VSADTVDNIGFRLRGNTSRTSAKKSYKVAINSFFPGRKYFGFEKLNLNGEHNDPSIIRSRLSWELFRDMEVPAPRSGHAELYINGLYMGLYINVEHIDEEFVLSRFGNQNGNLYKCLYPADLHYMGTDPEDYKVEFNGRRVYELKTNESLDDYSGLAHFIDILNNTPDPAFRQEIEKVLDVDLLLRTLAVEIFIGHWDNYAYNQNNYYLYQHPGSGKFIYIPYDTDNTYGIDWIGRDWGTRDIYDWASHSGVRPLYWRILDVPEFKSRFSYYLDQLMTVHADPATYFPQIDQIKTLIDPSALADTFRTLDWGFDIPAYHNSFTAALGGVSHVPYGLKPFIQARSMSAQAQLQLSDIEPAITQVQVVGAAVVSDPVRILARVEDEDPAPVVSLFYAPDGAAFQSVSMFDDGMHGDGQAADHFYGGEIPAQSVPGIVRYYVEATDNMGHTGREPYSGDLDLYVSTHSGSLYINEFMADNDGIITDNAGDFDDWVELYNAGPDPVWLGDKYLTDNFSNPDKWLMPDTTLAAGGFILFWADDDLAQGSNHTNFKLSKSGEELGIFDAGLAALDSFTFGSVGTDISFGYLPNGTPPVVQLPYPTPGYSNSTAQAIEDLALPAGLLSLEIFPNPFDTNLIIAFDISESAAMGGELTDDQGRQVIRFQAPAYHPGAHRFLLDTRTQLPLGMYYLRLYLNPKKGDGPHALPAYKVIIAR